MIQSHVVVIAACPHRGLAHRGRSGLQFPNNKQSLVPCFDRREFGVIGTVTVGGKVELIVNTLRTAL